MLDKDNCSQVKKFTMCLQHHMLFMNVGIQYPGDPFSNYGEGGDRTGGGAS